MICTSHDHGRQPKLLNLIGYWKIVGHRREVVTRRTRYELAIAEGLAHILEGLKIALDNIDAVIKTSRLLYYNDESAYQSPCDIVGLSGSRRDAVLETSFDVLRVLEHQSKD